MDISYNSKDLGSWGHAELLARQVLQSPHLVASAALLPVVDVQRSLSSMRFLGETLLLQHGESLTEAYWRPNSVGYSFGG